jgi:hypothetical protein
MKTIKIAAHFAILGACTAKWTKLEEGDGLDFCNYASMSPLFETQTHCTGPDGQSVDCTIDSHFEEPRAECALQCDADEGCNAFSIFISNKQSISCVGSADEPTRTSTKTGTDAECWNMETRTDKDCLPETCGEWDCKAWCDCYDLIFEPLYSNYVPEDGEQCDCRPETLALKDPETTTMTPAPATTTGEPAPALVVTDLSGPCRSKSEWNCKQHSACNFYPSRNNNAVNRFISAIGGETCGAHQCARICLSKVIVAAAQANAATNANQATPAPIDCSTLHDQQYLCGQAHNCQFFGWRANNNARNREINVIGGKPCGCCDNTGCQRRCIDRSEL